jgi:CRISPR/Cas system endoribonuclease Cas6 (RAMP superfamily)
LNTLYNNLNEVILTALTGDFMDDFDEYEREAFTEFHSSEIYKKFRQLLKDKWEDMTSTFINHTIKKNMIRILEVLLCNKDLLDKEHILDKLDK